MCFCCLVEPRLPSTPFRRVYTSCSFLLRALYFLVSSSVCCSWRHRGASSSLTPPLCPCHLQSCCKSRHSARGQREHEREEHKRDRHSRSTTEEDLIGICPLGCLMKVLAPPCASSQIFQQKTIHLAIIFVCEFSCKINTNFTAVLVYFFFNFFLSYVCNSLVLEVKICFPY